MRLNKEQKQKLLKWKMKWDSPDDIELKKLLYEPKGKVEPKARQTRLDELINNIK